MKGRKKAFAVTILDGISKRHLTRGYIPISFLHSIKKMEG